MWLIDSSIGRKLVMSITGLFLILFLLFHMSMNLVAIISGDAYNTICGFLGSNWYAVAGTMVLAAGVVLHLIFAVILTMRNQKARGSQSYSTSEKSGKVEWASQNMFVLGFIVIVGLGIHLYHFWSKMMLVELAGLDEFVANGVAVNPTDGAALIQYTFSQPINCILYLVWFAALWFHLTHGFWSAFQTMGLDGKTWFCRLKCIANVVATVIFLGFAAVVAFGYFQNF